METGDMCLPPSSHPGFGSSVVQGPDSRRSYAEGGGHLEDAQSRPGLWACGKSERISRRSMNRRPGGCWARGCMRGNLSLYQEESLRGTHFK